MRLNIYKRLVCGLLAVLLVVTGIPLPATRYVGIETVFAQSSKDGIWEYSILSDGTLEITGYTGEKQEIVIPDKIDGISVTRIGSSVFRWYSDLQNIKLPSGIKSIGNFAFDGCSNLRSIELPEGISKIGTSAFSGCNSLESVYIPRSVTNIVYGAFARCSSLTNIEVSLENEKYLSENGLVFNKNKSKLICCPGGKEGIIEVPNEVMSIEKEAFRGCSGIRSIKLPSNLRYIDAWTFDSCSNLCNIEISSGVTSIGQDAFNGCSRLGNIEIPSAVISIGTRAFKGCNSLSDIEIPNGVTRIEDSTFADCTNLRSIKIPEGVINIGNHAFASCSSLSDIDIPSGVTSIGSFAFEYCSNLSSINIPRGITSIEWRTFAGCSSLRNITLPSKVTSIAGFAFENCTNLCSIELTSRVTSIENGARGSFVGCNNLTIYSPADSYACTYAKNNGINWKNNKADAYSPGVTTESDLAMETLKAIVRKKLKDGLVDIDFANGKFKGPSLEIKDGEYTFTPLNFEFDAGLPLSKLNYQAVIDPEDKTIKVILGLGKSGEANIEQKSNMKKSEWSKQYNELKSLYKDMTGKEAKGSNSEGKNNWNRFEQLKANLNKMKCDMLIDADLEIMGYIEYDYSTGYVNFKEGGIIERAQIQGNLNFPIYMKCVYTTLGLGVSECGTLKLEKNGESFIPSCELELSATAKASIVGQIVTEEIFKAEGGIDAKLWGKMATEAPKFSVGMKGELFVKIKALCGIVDWEDEWEYLDCTIYPEFKNNKPEMISYSSTEGSVDDMLASASITARMNGDDSSAYDEYGSSFSKRVYDSNNAKMISYGNHLMLVWLDDNGEKSDKNRTSLMYSIYDGTTWTEAQTVVEDGCFFGEFDICADENSNVYIVYQKGNQVFSDDIEYKDIIRDIDLYCIKYDGTTFGEPVRITENNENYEMDMHAYVNENKAEISWLEYSSDYMAGETSEKKVCKQQYDFSTMKLADKTVTYTSNSIVSIENLKGDIYILELSAEDELYNLVRIEQLGNTIVDTFSNCTQLQSDGNKIYYINNGELYGYNENGIVSTQLEICDFKIGCNTNKTGVFTTMNDGENTKILFSELVDGIGQEFEIMAVDSQYVKDYVGCIAYDNQPIATLSKCNLVKTDGNYEYEDMRLVTTGKTDYVSLATDAVYYDNNKMLPGASLPLEFQITNSGNVVSDEVSVMVKDEAGNVVAQQVLEETINAGETKWFTIDYIVPTELHRHTLSVEIISSMDKDTTDNTRYMDIGLSELELTDVTVEPSCLTSVIRGTIENVGYEDAEEVFITLSQNTEDGEVEIVKSEIGTIKIGEKTEIEIPCSNANLIKDMNEYLSLNIVVSSNTQETDYVNNEVKLFEKQNLFGHIFSEYESNLDADYEKDGTKTAVCDRDNCNEKDIIEDNNSKLIDTKNPLVEIRLDNKVWTELPDEMVVGDCFREKQIISIFGSDIELLPDSTTVNRLESVAYYLSSELLTEEELESVEWNSIDNEGTIEIVLGEKYIIYAKAIDKSGNISYAASDVIIVESETSSKEETIESEQTTTKKEEITSEQSAKPTEETSAQEEVTESQSSTKQAEETNKQEVTTEPQEKTTKSEETGVQEETTELQETTKLEETTEVKESSIEESIMESTEELTTEEQETQATVEITEEEETTTEQPTITPTEETTEKQETTTEPEGTTEPQEATKPEETTEQQSTKPVEETTKLEESTTEEQETQSTEETIEEKETTTEQPIVMPSEETTELQATTNPEETTEQQQTKPVEETTKLEESTTEEQEMQLTEEKTETEESSTDQSTISSTEDSTEVEELTTEQQPTKPVEETTKLEESTTQEPEETTRLEETTTEELETTTEPQEMTTEANETHPTEEVTEEKPSTQQTTTLSTENPTETEALTTEQQSTKPEETTELEELTTEAQETQVPEETTTLEASTDESQETQEPEETTTELEETTEQPPTKLPEENDSKEETTTEPEQVKQKLTSISLATSSYTYNGYAKKPVPTVKCGTKKLVKNTDYKVTYKNNVNPGTATVIVTGTGNYTGTLTKTFKINLEKVSSLKQKTSYATSKIAMSWNKVKGANGYEVYRATSKNSTYKYLKTVTTNSYTQSGIQPGSKYYYKVRAYKTVNGKKVYGAYSERKSMITKPATPTITLTAGSKRIKVSWKKSSGANGYEVYMATSRNGSYTKIKSTNSLQFHYTKTGLLKGKKYYFKVRAFKKTGVGVKVYSGYSSIKTVTVK